MLDNLELDAPRPVSVSPETEAPTLRKVDAWQLAWRALFLDERAHRAILAHESPTQTGMIVLLLIFLIAGVARALGLFWGTYIAPQYGTLQDTLGTMLALDEGILRVYNGVWQLLGLLGVIPTRQGALMALILICFLGFVSWWLYGVVAHGLALWQGAGVGRQNAHGIAALSFAPLLLMLVAIVPGAGVPYRLMLIWSMLIQYQGYKIAYGLSWPRTIVTVVGPYLIVGVLLGGILLFGAASLGGG